MPLEVCLGEIGVPSSIELDMKTPADVELVQQAVINANDAFFKEAEIKLWRLRKATIKLRMSEDRYQVLHGDVSINFEMH